ncbi:7TM diverse intracellular signaling domain-containing protein [Deltaproteobacteria bacterium TL4]
MNRSILLLCLFLWSPSSLKAETLVLADPSDFYRLGPYLDLLEDPEGNKTIETISHAGPSSSFVPSQSNEPNVGYSSSTFWIRLTIKNPLPVKKQFVLEIGPPYLDYLTLYIPQQQTYLKKKTGALLPYNTREIPHRLFLFPVEISANQSLTYYFSIKSQSTISIEANLRSTVNLIEHVRYEQYLFGVYYGTMLIMLFYNLLLYGAILDKSYLYYVLYLGFFISYQLSAHGFANEFLWPDSPEFSKYNLIFSTVGFIYSIFLFARNFLNTPQNTPTLDQWLIRVLVLVSLWFVTTFFMPYATTARTGAIISAISLFLLLWIGLKCLWLQVPSAKYFMLAWSTLIAGIVLVLLGMMGVLPGHFIVKHSYQIGSVLEMMLLSLGLAARINHLKREKSIAQHQTLQAQQEAIENLKKADQLKDEFLANTSHELRTPLHGIIGLGESILDGVGGPVTVKQAENLRMLVQSGKRLSNLVNDLLDFSKMKNQELQLQLRPVDIKSTVDIVLALSQTLIGNKAIHLTSEVPQDFLLVWADENRLQQILINLLGNALKFTHAGTVLVSAEVKANLKIESHGESVGKEEVHQRNENINPECIVIISVSDTGIGIPKDKQQRIFLSFEQVDGSTAREYGGTGLGLTVTKQLVELHGGTIKVESQEGQGSVFSFSLPVASNQNPAQEKDKRHFPQQVERVTEAQVPDTTGALDSRQNLRSEAEDTRQSMSKNDAANQKYTIMIVDDEPVNIQVLQNQLGMKQYQTLTAQNGLQALELLREQAEKGVLPDLILLDLMMPRMSGYEVCQQVRTTYNKATLPIVMLTAKNQLNDLVHGFNCGASDYLTKPFHKEELLSRVDSHLKIKEAVEVLKEGERQKMELKTAQTVQELLIPKSDPILATIEISSFYKSASEIGGDWYHYYYHPEIQTLDVVIGDVTGHGVPAALITAMVNSLYNAVASQELKSGEMGLDSTHLLHPSYFMELLNDVLCDTTRGLYHMTMFYSVIDLKHKRIIYSSAAHNPCYVWRPSGFEVEGNPKKTNPFSKLFIPGHALGATPGQAYRLETMELKQDDVIVWYTDGITENYNEKEEYFGIRRLKHVFQKAQGLSAEEIKNRIIEKAYQHYGTTPQEDDITLIVAKIK